MSLIYRAQIDKAKTLVEGLKNNRSFLSAKGFDVSIIERLDKHIEELTRESEALAIEEQALSQHRVLCHNMLDHLKYDLNIGKTSIKNMFDMEQWQQYGVTDKR